jgi:SAM-dependent methyltransferase
MAGHNKAPALPMRTAGAHTGHVYSRSVSGPSAPPAPLFLQNNQPEGVPPLALTGERTLPDVPVEDYWFRRLLAGYVWIAARLAGLRANDMACGEGYRSIVLALRAASLVGVDANPEAHEHARLRYTRPNLRFARDLVETFSEPADAVVFLQTIEHLQDPAAVLRHFKSLVGEGGVVFVSTPNVLTLAPKGAERSDNPWHVHEYRSDEFEMLCRDTFARVEMYGLFHTRKLQLHAIALKLGWDRVHPRLRLTKPFYDRFTPAIAASDFVLRAAPEAHLDKALDFIAVCRP